MLLSEIARLADGLMLGSDVAVSAVDIDSRACADGALFVALRGERVDGHDFLSQARERGAAAALVERFVAGVDLPQIKVADSVAALGAIAGALRSERQSTVLALTGSNGKTTVKTLLESILSGVAPTWANAGNRNNEIGMPLALIDEPADTRFAIYEMGAGQPGDIAYLAHIAAPQIALVNNIGPAHLERMGSLLGIAETKGAIYAALPADGIAVINADDAFALWFAQRAAGRRLLRFGLEADADVRASQVRAVGGATSFRLHAPIGEIVIALPLTGRHNLRNALAAASMALAAGASLTDIAEGLARAQPVAGRQTLYRLASGAALIDDSYNANPGSMAAAIASLAEGGGERWLVLGDMRELGPQARELHAAVGREARAAGITALLTVGDLAAAASASFGPGGEHFADQAALIERLQSSLRAGVRCLVKGSRGSRMDRVVAALHAPVGEASHAA